MYQVVYPGTLLFILDSGTARLLELFRKLASLQVAFHAQGAGND